MVLRHQGTSLHRRTPLARPTKYQTPLSEAGRTWTAMFFGIGATCSVSDGTEQHDTHDTTRISPAMWGAWTRNFVPVPESHRRFGNTSTTCTLSKVCPECMPDRTTGVVQPVPDQSASPSIHRAPAVKLAKLDRPHLRNVRVEAPRVLYVTLNITSGTVRESKSARAQRRGTRATAPTTACAPRRCRGCAETGQYSAGSAAMARTGRFWARQHPRRRSRTNLQPSL